MLLLRGLLLRLIDYEKGEPFGRIKGGGTPRKSPCFSILVALLLAGCMLNSVTKTESPRDAIDDATDQARELLAEEADKVDTVLLVDGRYVGNAVVSGPEWIGSWIEFRADAVTTKVLIDLACLQIRQRCLVEDPISRADEIQGDESSPDYYQGDQQQQDQAAMPGQDPSLHFLQHSGTVAQLLHRIELLTGKAYVVDGNSILWTDELVEVFDVSYLPGAVSFALGNSGAGGGQGGGGQGGQGGSGGGQGGSGGSISAVDNQSLTIDGSTTPWDELKSVIDILTSTGANAYLDQANSQLIVSGNRAHLAKARTLVAQLNDKFTRQIVIDVALVQLTLSDTNNFGVDWNATLSRAGHDGNLRISSGSFANASTTGTGLSPTAITISRTGDGLEQTGTAVLNALATQGTLKVLTRPRAVTLNGQITSISLITQVGYLARTVPGTSNAATGQTSTSAGLEPGVADEGFTLYVLPKITPDGRVLMQISARVARLAALTSVSSGSQSIQVPTLSENRFIHRAIINPGDTMVIGGVREDRTTNNKSIGAFLSFGRGVSDSVTETMLVITPTVQAATPLGG